MYVCNYRLKIDGLGIKKEDDKIIIQMNMRMMEFAKTGLFDASYYL